ncbi:MAG: redoxin family protein [Paracoccaceae bacterium]
MPEATMMVVGAIYPEPVELAGRLTGARWWIRGAGAFTPTCHSAHVPSFLRVMDGLKGKGVDEVICTRCTTLGDAGLGRGDWRQRRRITMLADSSGGFTKALGMDFDAPPVGFVGRLEALCADGRGLCGQGAER